MLIFPFFLILFLSLTFNTFCFPFLLISSFFNFSALFFMKAILVLCFTNLLFLKYFFVSLIIDLSLSLLINNFVLEFF